MVKVPVENMEYATFLILLAQSLIQLPNQIYSSHFLNGAACLISCYTDSLILEGFITRVTRLLGKLRISQTPISFVDGQLRLTI